MYAHNKYTLTSKHVHKELTLAAPARGRLDAGSQPAKAPAPGE